MRNNYYTLITGASEGFGKALALECASRKMNLILVALPFSGLANLAGYIKKNFEVRVVFFEYDLSGNQACYRLFNEISSQGLPVNILINNAGIGGTHFFDDRDAEFYSKQIELNVIVPTLMIRLFLNILELHRPAYILNVSSLASFFYLPGKQVYGATKSFLLSFSKSLRPELMKKKVYVSVVCPGGMNTNAALTMANFSQKGFNRWSIMNPEAVAKITINKMLKKKEVIIPGRWNRFFLFLDKILPAFIKNWITMLFIKDINKYKPQLIPFNYSLKTAV